MQSLASLSLTTIGLKATNLFDINLQFTEYILWRVYLQIKEVYISRLPSAGGS
jgi:hypothetical protein